MEKELGRVIGRLNNIDDLHRAKRLISIMLKEQEKKISEKTNWRTVLDETRSRMKTLQAEFLKLRSGGAPLGRIKAFARTVRLEWSRVTELMRAAPDVSLTGSQYEPNRAAFWNFMFEFDELLGIPMREIYRRNGLLPISFLDTQFFYWSLDLFPEHNITH